MARQPTKSLEDYAAEMADLTLEAMKNLPTAERERRIRSAEEAVASFAS